MRDNSLFFKFFAIFSAVVTGVVMVLLLTFGEEKNAGVVLAFGMMVSYLPRILCAYDKDGRE